MGLFDTQTPFFIILIASKSKVYQAHALARGQEDYNALVGVGG
jgi:hypothetical protein